LAQARPPVWLIQRSSSPTCDVRGRGPGDLAAGACNEQRPDPTEIAPREVQEHRRTIAAVLAFALSHLVFVPLPLWTVLTAVILTQVTFGRSVRATLDYLPGTVGGARRLTFIGLRAGRRQVPVRRPQMSCEKRNPSAKLEYDNPFNVGMTGVLGIATGYHERIAAVRRFDYGPNAFVQRRETSVQSSLRESSSRNSVGVRKSQTVHHSAHRPPGRLRRSLSAFRPLRRPRWTG
jgi:hypothetical protein